MAIDLHVHSSYSDGCLSPKQLVERAHQLGVSALAITDHDTLAGVPEALSYGRDLGVFVLPGIELSCEGYHILGYGVDCGYQPLREQLEELAQARAERAARIVDRLAVAGIHLSLERVQELAGAGVVGRPHVAAALVEKGYASNTKDAFARFLNKGQPGYVPRYRLSVDRAINLVKGAGGIPVWAHPGDRFSRQCLQELKSCGVMGVEVWHPDHNKDQMLWFADQGAREGLLVTGGSDFHCPQLGEAELASHATPLWAWAALRAAF